MRKIIGLILIVLATMHVSIYSSTLSEERMDYSSRLQQFLENKMADSNESNIKVYKEHDFYHVIIKSSNSKIIKKIPESDVINLFEGHSDQYESIILKIISKPGTK